MTAAATFTLRPLERNTPDTALEGGFRVHLASKELKALQLSVGDLICLSTTSGERKGFAIAWLASQINPGNKPIAKVTDLLREKYALSLNDRIFIEKVDEDCLPIDSVEIKSSASSGATGCYSSGELLYWAAFSLVQLDVILPGCTFDIQQQGLRSRQRSPKLRAIVGTIEPTPDTRKPLYFDPLKTRVIITDEMTVQTTIAPLDGVLQMKAHSIGGLSDQVRTINRRLDLLTNPTFSLTNQHLLGPTTFLIHGPEGTGKSLLLDRLSECAWREIFKLDAVSNSKASTKDLSDTFEKARRAQPSLVLMDELDKYLGKADALLYRLRAELKKLKGTKVVVAASTRSVYDIDASLRTSFGFRQEIEIFPPNIKQREDMLRQVIGGDQSIPTVDFALLAERTHGFVGRDIETLCGLAREFHTDSIAQAWNCESTVSFDELDQSQDFLTQHDFDSVIDRVRPTVLKDSILEVPKVRWTDIAGLGHVQELLEAIMIRPFKVPDLDIKFGGPQSRKGVLLYGPPGCAKTLIAQAVATESNLNFLAVKGSELIKMYVGESERAIRDVFRRARAAKPCIIFFDEIDSIGKSREKSQDSGLNVVTTLLNEMDGIEALKEVFIIGATNRPDILDTALIRQGRFDAHIHIGLPTEDARRQIFEIHTRKLPIAGGVDLNILASRTEGSSGADIKGLCSVAVDMAKSDYTQNPQNQPEVRMCHFEQALEEHVPHTVQEEAERYKDWRPGRSLSAA